jgi:excisionase family DNA binding protein
MSDTEYLTVEEFSRRCPNISLPTVRRYVKSGKLPSVQPGGKGCKILIPADALETCRREQQATSKPLLLSPPAKSKPKSKPTRPARRPNWLADTSS